MYKRQGLGGPVTFKNAKTPKEVAADVDLAHLQIETDCPYLTPVPYRGKRNEPMYLPLTAKTILELRGMEEETLKQSLWDNYQALFHPQDVYKRQTFFISLCSGNSGLVIHRRTGNSGAAKMD